MKDIVEFEEINDVMQPVGEAFMDWWGAWLKIIERQMHQVCDCALADRRGTGNNWRTTRKRAIQEIQDVLCDRRAARYFIDRRPTGDKLVENQMDHARNSTLANRRRTGTIGGPLGCSLMGGPLGPKSST